MRIGDRFVLGVATFGDQFTSSAVLDCATGDIYPFDTIETAELALSFMEVGDDLGWIPGIALEFTALEVAVEP